MNIKELKKELFDDYYSLNRTLTTDRLTDVYHHERVRAKIKKEDEYSRFYDIKTKSKNHWVFHFSKNPIIPKFHHPQDSVNMSFCYFNSPHGIQVLILDTLGRSYVFNAHLFHRYKERMNLNISNSLDLVKHYLTRNYSVVYKLLRQEDVSCKFYGMVLDGFVLGNYHQEYNWFENKTFLSYATTNYLLSKFERDFYDSFQLEIKKLDPKKDLMHLNDISLIMKALKH